MLSTHVSVELKVENSAKTTFRFSPVRYRVPAQALLTNIKLSLKAIQEQTLQLICPKHV